MSRARSAKKAAPEVAPEIVVEEAPRETGNPASVEVFSFGEEAARSLTAIPALERMNERAARMLRQRMESISRLKLRIHAEPVAVEEFESWKDEQPEFTSIGLYRFPPLKGGILISIEPSLIIRLVDAYYGGSGVYGERPIKEFTPTEERLLARLSEALAETLTEVWSEVLPIKAQLTSRETSTAYLGLGGSDDRVAIARLYIILGKEKPARIDIVYPVASLRAVEGQLAARIQDDAGANAGEWKERLSSAIQEVRLQARSVLARPTLSVSEFLSLKAGDVIPISKPALVPLLVAGRQIALGTIGEQDGRAALKIAHIEPRRVMP
jgi:flagellar motor switch protein FliM